MTLFNYTGGNPSDLQGGGIIDFADVRESFNDVDNYLDNAGLDGQNLAQSFFSPYLTVQSEQNLFEDHNMTGAGSYHASDVGRGNGPTMRLSGATGSTRTPVLVPIITSDFTIAGRTPQMRLLVDLTTNATAIGVNLTFGLFSVSGTSGSAGAFVTTMGSAVSGSTITRNAPAASSIFRDASADFALPSSGVYLFGVTTTGAIASGSSCGVTFTLQVHWI